MTALIIAVVALILSLVIIALGGSTSQIRGALDDYRDVAHPIDDIAHAMETDLTSSAMSALAYLDGGDSAQLALTHARLTEFRANRTAIDALAPPDEIEAILGDLDRVAASFRADVDAAIASQRRLEAAQRRLVIESGRIDVLLDDGLQSGIDQGDADGMVKLQSTVALEINVSGLSKALTHEPIDATRIAMETAEFWTNHAKLGHLVRTPVERRLVHAIGDAFERLSASVADLVIILEARTALRQSILGGAEALHQLLDTRLRPAALRTSGATFRAIGSALDDASLVVGIHTLVGTALGTGLILLCLQLQVRRPIGRLIAATDSLARGDLDSRVEVGASGDVATLLASFNRMATARKASEDEVARLNAALHSHVEELQESNRELESFTYSVSHDLRAPLRAIDGFAQMIDDRYGASMDAVGRDQLATVRMSARRMGVLIDDLLRLSRLGRQAVRPIPVEPGDIVRSIADESGILADPNVELVIGQMPAVKADPALIRQVYANLLQNAYKFSRQSRPARIEVGATNDISADGNQETVYYVRDNGAGFDDRYASKLFGVFQRLHRADEFEGTGVGLAIVQRIVDRHGGRIWATGKVGRGATISFTLAGGQ